MLSDHQLLRYSRHIFLPELDIKGQQALLDSRVLVLGAGGLGSPLLLYLAAAGIGHMVISDPDVVDESNLQRQVIHTQGDIGTPKVQSAARQLKALNPELELTLLAESLASIELTAQARQANVLVVGTDNFSSRYAANLASRETGTPLVSAAAIAWEGQLSSFDPRQPESPCFACLYPEGQDEALRCADSGVISPLVGVLGSLQALEVVKLITGAGEPLVGRLQIFDALNGQWQTFALPRHAGCRVCG